MKSTQKILVVGATSAIAQETMRIFAREGHNLFLVGRSREKLAAISADLRVCGAPNIEFAELDVTSTSQHSGILQRAIDFLGGLDIAVIAHGILGDSSLAHRDFPHAREILETNFISTVSLLTWLANWFEEREAGQIVVISSVAGDRGRQSNYVYGASKGALDIFLSGLRNRLFRSGISVLLVKPGFVNTPMTAHLQKNFLYADPETVACGIVKAVRKGRDVVYIPSYWRLIMLLTRLIPEVIFKRMNL